jgi:superfamily II DNA helicase RecQ
LLRQVLCGEGLRQEGRLSCLANHPQERLRIGLQLALTHAADRSLIDMVRQKPATPDQFALVNGVGERKLEAYAEAFLGVIGEA